eukprot:4850134-Pyramimonas_sp.AAC.1
MAWKRRAHNNQNNSSVTLRVRRISYVAPIELMLDFLRIPKMAMSLLHTSDAMPRRKFQDLRVTTRSSGTSTPHSSN